MKIRILSDLHIDINKDHLHLFEWADKDVFTVISGDTAGSLAEAAPFIRKHFNNAILIGGNHILYNDEGKTIQQLHYDYRNEFPLDASISYLENDYKEIDGVVFIGATLWTNYEYGGDNVMNEAWAERGINDFRWGNFSDPTGTSIPLRSRHCWTMFQKSIRFITETYDNFANKGKKVVLVVHHGVSPKAISRAHKLSPLNAAYISDLEEYIKDRLPDLSLIIHGHVHNRFKYKIGSIPVICNPCGYISYGEHKQTPRWNKNFIIEI